MDPRSQSIPHLISSRSVPLIAANNGRRRRLLSSITVAQYPRIHPLRLLLFTGSVLLLLLLLHFCPRVCWSPFSIWPSRRSLKGRPLDRHSNHSTSPIVGLLSSFSLFLSLWATVFICSGSSSSAPVFIVHHWLGLLNSPHSFTSATSTAACFPSSCWLIIMSDPAWAPEGERETHHPHSGIMSCNFQARSRLDCTGVYASRTVRPFSFSSLGGQ